MTKPLVSIIIPLYNKENSIATTINSVLDQSFKNFEIVVVNDGSTDGSENKVKEFTDHRVRLITQSNHGVSYTRNAGIKAAVGDWIMFLDADDVLLPDGLKHLTDNITDNETIVAGNFLVNCENYSRPYIRNNKDSLYESQSIYKAITTMKIFLRAGSFIISTACIKTQKFNEKFKRWEDMEFLIRILDNFRVQYIPKLIMSYDLSLVSASIANDEQWDKDYGFYLPFERKKFWKNCVLGIVLDSAIKGYPARLLQLKELYGKYYKYHYYAYIIGRLAGIRRRFLDLFDLKK